MAKYIALLRGINVGGKALIKMADLKDMLDVPGLSNVQTYIQSGNLIFESKTTSTDKLADTIKAAVKKDTKLEVGVAVFSEKEWADIISGAPKWWGKDKSWKHNLLIMIKPYDMEDVLKAVSEIKPEIESIKPGKGVLYQSMSLIKFGQTSSSKLITNSLYKKMTIRNYNTSTKLLELLK